MILGFPYDFFKMSLVLVYVSVPSSVLLCPFLSYLTLPVSVFSFNITVFYFPSLETCSLPRYFAEFLTSMVIPNETHMSKESKLTFTNNRKHCLSFWAWVT